MIPNIPTANDQKNIDRFKRLQSMESTSVRNGDWPLISHESRAAIVEKLFSLGRDLNKHHIFKAIALFDRFLTDKTSDFEYILIAGLTSLGITIQDDPTVPESFKKNLNQFMNGKFDDDTLDEINEEVSKHVIDESNLFFLDYVDIINSLLLARTSEKGEVFIAEIVSMFHTFLKSVMIDAEVH